MVALARTTAGRPVRPAGVPLAVLTGVTWASNAVGADLAWAGGVAALAALGYGVRGRADQRILVGIAGLAALVFLLGAFALGEA